MRLLTIEEVAERLRCEHKFVRGLIHSGELRARRAGRRWLIAEEWLCEWIERPERPEGAVSPVRPRVVQRFKPRLPRSSAGSLERLAEIERAAG